MTDAPLEGVLVLELGQIYCGPYCGFLLARLGAEVIKIEPPSGELNRHRTAPGVEPVSLSLLNTNKTGLRLDLKTEEGKDVLRSLVVKADVLVENFAAGVMDRLGVGYDALAEINPQLIYAGATGFGRGGPYSGLGAMDLTVQAMTGVMDSTGYADMPPVKAGVAVADFAGGTHLALAVVSALLQRGTTGAGQRVDVSMQDALLPYLTSSISGFLTSGAAHPARMGNQHGALSVSPYNVYPARDGFVAILCAADRHWLRLCELMNRPELARDSGFEAMTARAARHVEIDELVGGWTSSRSRSEIVGLLTGGGIPVAPVLTVPEVLEDENLVTRGMVQQIDHPTLGRTLAYGSPIHLSASDPIEPTPAPQLGQHSEQILSGHLGMSADEVAALRTKDVV